LPKRYSVSRTRKYTSINGHFILQTPKKTFRFQNQKTHFNQWPFHTSDLPKRHSVSRTRKPTSINGHFILQTSQKDILFPEPENTLQSLAISYFKPPKEIFRFQNQKTHFSQWPFHTSDLPK
ncbi:hypothetical protein SK128_019841, partial [Halocaridina rubra]